MTNWVLEGFTGGPSLFWRCSLGKRTASSLWKNLHWGSFWSDLIQPTCSNCRKIKWLVNLEFFVYTHCVFNWYKVNNCYECVQPLTAESCWLSFVGTSYIVCGAGFIKRYSVRPSVCLSVPAWDCLSIGVKPAVAGLLLWAQRAGDINWLLQQWRVNAGSATLSAYVGSWIQTCLVCSETVISVHLLLMFSEFVIWHLWLWCCQQEIMEALEKLCSMLPGTLNASCTSFVDEYVPAIIEMLRQQMDPELVCNLLGICSDKSMNAAGQCLVFLWLCATVDCCL